MKVAVSSTGPTMDSMVDPRFGRAAYFLIVDTETMEFEAVPNPAASMPSGAGPMAVQVIASHGVEAVITGHVGPNAFAAVQAAGIKVYQAPPTTVAQAVEMFKNNQLSEFNAPFSGPGGGPGFGGGFGRGGGWGRGGFGGGWGRGGFGRGPGFGGGFGPGGGF